MSECAENILLLRTEQPPPGAQTGELLVAVSVLAANVVKDIQQNIRNLIGGPMVHYERLVEQAVETALGKLRSKAHSAGYDGVYGVLIAHPQVVDGGVEIIVYGNGYRQS